MANGHRGVHSGTGLMAGRVIPACTPAGVHAGWYHRWVQEGCTREGTGGEAGYGLDDCLKTAKSAILGTFGLSLVFHMASDRRKPTYLRLRTSIFEAEV